MPAPLITPVLKTPRLVLRAMTMDDAPRVAEICNDRRMAEYTLTLPHPYALSDAQWWIGKHTEWLATGEQMILALTLREATGADAAGTLIGSVALMFKFEHDRAEMGYSVGVAYWNKGYVTEAAGEMMRYAFEELKLNRVHAHHYAENAASGRIMQKIGMAYEGALKQHIKKWGVYHDSACYGMTADQWRARASGG